MKVSALARTVQEGGNFLGVFLCTGALRALREQASSPEVNALLANGLATYAPAFRAVHGLSGATGDVEPALERLDVLTRLGVSFEARREVAELRAAIRELLAGVGFELPSPAPRERAACELHGKGCPVLSGGGEPSAGARRGAGAARPSASRSGGRVSRRPERKRRGRSGKSPR